MDTNTCPACGLSLTGGGPSTFAQPQIGNLRTGTFEPSGDRPARVHAECTGKVGRGDLLWVKIDEPAT